MARIYTKPQQIGHFRNKIDALRKAISKQSDVVSKAFSNGGNWQEENRKLSCLTVDLATAKTMLKNAITINYKQPTQIKHFVSKF